MTNVSVVKVGGVCAILTTVSFIVAGILGGVSGEQTLIPVVDEVVDWLVVVNGGRAAFLASGWVILLVPVLAIAAVLGLYYALRQAGHLLWIAVVASVSGALLVQVSHIIPLAMAWELAPGYVAASDATKPALEVIARTLAMSSQLMNTVGDTLFLGVGILLFAISILRTSVLPKWTGWLGLVPAVLWGWLGLLNPISDVIEGIGTIGFLAFFLWMVAIGVTMLRLREPA